MSRIQFLNTRIDYLIRYRIKALAAVLLTLVLSSCFYDEGLEEDPIETVSFAADIQPILTNNCTSCHPVLVAPPDLTEGPAYNAITNGVYIVPNDLENSLLYQRLLGNPSVMPPTGSLPASQIQLFETWIEQGAPDN